MALTIEQARQKLYDFGLHHAINDLPHSQFTVEAFELADKALEEYDRNKWVNVKNHLPKTNGWYQTVIDFGEDDERQRYVMNLFFRDGKWIDNIRQSVFNIFEVRNLAGERLYTDKQLCDRTKQVTHWAEQLSLPALSEECER